MQLLYHAYQGNTISNVIYDLIFLFSDFIKCLSNLQGKDEVINTIVFPETSVCKRKTFQVSKHKLRSLKLPWMYQNHGLLWLSDEVQLVFAE